MGATGRERDGEKGGGGREGGRGGAREGCCTSTVPISLDTSAPLDKASNYTPLIGLEGGSTPKVYCDLKTGSKIHKSYVTYTKTYEPNLARAIASISSQ